MLKEFKEFALRGNLLEIAVGLVLALAFTTVINAFIDGILMPLIAAIVGKPSFDAITWTIGSGADAAVILIGTFITAVVNFLLIAFVLFLIVKAANRMQKPAPEEAGPTEIELLTQIRDALANRSPSSNLPPA
jgi:large conductance mechanosensitive channel